MLCRTRSKLQWSILIVLFISFPLLFTRFHFEYTTQTVQIASHLFDNTRTMEIETTNKKTSRFTWSLHSWHGIHTLNDYWEFFISIFFIKFNNRKLFHTQNLNQNWYILIISLRTAIFVSVLNTGSPARTVWTVWALFLFFIKCTHHTHSSFIFRL